jgi:hypothetical protein
LVVAGPAAQSGVLWVTTSFFTMHASVPDRFPVIRANGSGWTTETFDSDHDFLHLIAKLVYIINMHDLIRNSTVINKNWWWFRFR